MENEKNLEEVQEELIPAEETAPVEETVPVEEIAPAEEAPAEEAASEVSKPEEKKVTPGKMALVIGAIVVVAAIIIALLVGGMQTGTPAEETEPAALDTEVVVPTVPADGNPDDETCKGTYTVTDAEVKAAADTVVAVIGEKELTNGQLQAFYWMQVQNFLSSQYGSMMMSYGMLDYTQPLDTQVCPLAEAGTWQQFFLKEALTTWHNYSALYNKAKEAGMELSAEEKEFLEKFDANLLEAAQYYGMENVEDFLYQMMGAGADAEDYRYFQEMLGYGNLYYDAEYAKINPTMEEMEAYFAENETALAENGITKEAYLVDVRHVLFTPEGGTADETGATTYSEEEWAACEARAQEVLDAWAAGEATEDSFAALAATHSQDPGSQNNGGLYEDVQQGQMVPEFDAWCFDASRQYGDYGMVKTTYGYHLMYFVDKTPIWQDYVHQTLTAQMANDMMENLVEEYVMEVDYSAISLGYVNLAS